MSRTSCTGASRERRVDRPVQRHADHQVQPGGAAERHQRVAEGPGERQRDPLVQLRPGSPRSGPGRWRGAVCATAAGAAQSAANVRQSSPDAGDGRRSRGRCMAGRWPDEGVPVAVSAGAGPRDRPNRPDRPPGNPHLADGPPGLPSRTGPARANRPPAKAAVPGCRPEPLSPADARPGRPAAAARRRPRRRPAARVARGAPRVGRCEPARPAPRRRPGDRLRGPRDRLDQRRRRPHLGLPPCPDRAAPAEPVVRDGLSRLGRGRRDGGVHRGVRGRGSENNRRRGDVGARRPHPAAGGRGGAVLHARTRPRRLRTDRRGPLRPLGNVRRRGRLDRPPRRAAGSLAGGGAALAAQGGAGGGARPRRPHGRGRPRRQPRRPRRAGGGWTR